MHSSWIVANRPSVRWSSLSLRSIPPHRPGRWAEARGWASTSAQDWSVHFQLGEIISLNFSLRQHGPTIGVPCNGRVRHLRTDHVGTCRHLRIHLDSSWNVFFIIYLLEQPHYPSFVVVRVGSPWLLVWWTLHIAIFGILSISVLNILTYFNHNLVELVFFMSLISHDLSYTCR